MARFSGKIGYVTRKETTPGVWTSEVIERQYYGDLVRHSRRWGSSDSVNDNITFSQESQRYVGYDKDKFGNQIEVITPLIDTDSSAYNDWHYAMLMAETQYMNLRKAGLPPEIARGVLPNDCKTELVVTATEKEWQHIITPC